MSPALDVAGWTIAYDDVPGNEGAAPAVLVHGASAHRGTWSDVVERLRGSRRLVVPDMPGHGTSSGPAPSDVGRWAEVLGEIVDRLDLAPVVVIGHSLGGAAAQAYYRRSPRTVRALGLVSTAPDFGVPPDVIDAWLADLPTYRDEVEPAIVAPHASDEVRRRLTAMRADNGDDALAADLRAIAAWSDPTWAKIDVPLFVMTSGADHEGIKQAMASWRDTVTGTTFVDLGGQTGHMMLVEAPDASADAIAGWLEGLE